MYLYKYMSILYYKETDTRDLKRIYDQPRVNRVE